MGAVFCYANEASLSAGSLCFLRWGHSHTLVIRHPSLAVLAFLLLLSPTSMSQQEAISGTAPEDILC